MTARHWWLTRVVPSVLLLGLAATLAWPLVGIQLRLSRNRAVAAQLVESLHSRFPEVSFRGNVAYNREVVYITAINALDETARQSVEQWLRRLKAEQGIAPTILLRFSDSIGEEKDMIKI